MNLLAFHGSIIEIPQWGRVTIIEALWLASGIMALVFSLLRIHPLYLDYRITQRLGQEDLCIIAFGYLRREALRVLTASAIVFTGVWVCVTKSAIPGPAFVTVTGLILTGSLFVVSLAVSAQSVLDWRDRKNTIAIVLKRDAHD